MPLNLSKINQVAVAQEFHISVTPLGEDEYLVRIEKPSAPGVPLAEEQVRWPVEEWLAQARQLMNDPLLGLLQEGRASAEDVFFLSEWDEPSEPFDPSTRSLVELGQNLYNALFQGSLRDSWIMAQAIAQNQRQVLRLRLGLKGTRLPRLPWEVLHAGDRPLATGTDVAFSRYQMGPRIWSAGQTFSPPPNQPLKILMVISGPSDQETLQLVQEANHLKEELKNRSAHGTPAIQLTILEQPGREQLTQSLEQGQYQVFHYAGHSNLGESGGDVYLVSNKTGLTETLNGNDLAGLLANNGVQLAVFNSCRGAYTASSSEVDNGTERNLAEALVKRGIPGVLAMAERIPDEVALTLTRLLYRNLNQGYPIDLSLSRARQGLISAYGSNQLYWALPVLYLHPECNGFLTTDTPEHQEELFVLPDPTDIALVPQTDEVVFTRSVMPSPVSEDNDNDYDNLLVNVDLNDSDPEGDDPAVFIKDLLNQLEPEPANREAVQPNVEAEHEPPPIPQPQVASWQLPAESPDDSIPAAEGSSPQAAMPAHLSQGARQAKARGLKGRWQTLSPLSKIWMGLGVLGIFSASVWAVGVTQHLYGQGKPPQPIPSTPATSKPEPKATLPTTEPAKLTNEATEQFRQGNIAAGEKAVESLLDQGALPQAKAALDAVPESKLEDPTVLFLKGRQAWQRVQSGDKNYELSDARRFWEQASKGQPKSVSYLTALGFAYYAEANYDRANKAWSDALSLIEEGQKGNQAAKTPPTKESLNTYAGLALGLWQLAQQQPARTRGELLSKSLKTRQYVMSADPVNFGSDALSKNWLWSEKAIQDWRSLLAVK
jgi:hypothetical protein